MADDNILRSYRSSNDPAGRGNASSDSREQAAGSDPLAELARLIGQTDPFAEFGKTSARASEPREPHPPVVPAPAAGSDWRKIAAAMPAYETRRQPTLSADPHFGAGHSDFPRRDPYQMASTAEAPGHPRTDGRQSPSQPRVDPKLVDTNRSPSRHDDAIESSAAHDDHGSEPYYDDGAAMGPDDNEMYDDPPRSRRRSGLITAVALIGCAMVGTAGAYGYRTYYVVPGTTRTPPVISADTTPSKVTPANDAQSSKSIQDRVADQGERVLPREEQPILLKDPAGTATPRVVLPAPVSPAPMQGVLQVPPAAAAPAPPAASGAPGPKPIRTVVIRSDGTEVNGKPVGSLPSSAVPAPAAPARATAAGKSSQPPARNGGVPLSLDPEAQASATPAPPPARERVAANPPQAAPRLASAPAAGGSGSHVVQLSSQKSEAEAQATFRSLQAKFPNELGDRAPIIRRADLGAKGTFYRTMVGPFGSADEAKQFCARYRAAGGQCVIPGN